MGKPQMINGRRIDNSQNNFTGALKSSSQEKVTAGIFYVGKCSPGGRGHIYTLCYIHCVYMYCMYHMIVYVI